MAFESIPEKIRRDAAGSIGLRGLRKLPINDWVASMPKVKPEKLKTAIHYFDISLAIYQDLTVMNWRAHCLKFLGEWETAISAFEEIARLARNNLPLDNAYLDLAKASIRFCRESANEGKSSPTTQSPEETEAITDPEHCQIAILFAEALIRGDFKGAHELLSTSLKKTVSPMELARSYKSMIPYTGAEIENIDVGLTMEDWPDKKPEDAGWVYVNMSGEGFAEAVTVIVCKELDRLVIRDIEWGRP
jgi:hypothetical protein